MKPQRSLPTFDAFEDPDGPDVKMLHLLHRQHDGYVAVSQKDHEGALLSTALRATELDGLFPSMKPVLMWDSYFSVNGFFRPGYGVSKLTDLGLPNANRLKSNLRWLTSCYVDLDAHSVGKDAADAMAAVMRAQESGDVPPATLLVNSGRGLWAFWRLVDAKNPTHPPGAFHEKLQLHAAIQNRLNSLFAYVGADAQAKDACRITRIPGSVNTKANVRVRYWLQADDDGQTFDYTLDALASTMNVQLRASRPLSLTSKDADNVYVVRARKGQAGRWRKARRNFELLWELRGGFGPGTRNCAVWVYATILRGLHLDEDDVQAECYRLFLDFKHDPVNKYTRKEFEDAVRRRDRLDKKGSGPPTNQTIADRLDVTPDEAAYLGHAWPCAQRFAKPVTIDEVDELSRPELTVRRRALIRNKAVELGGKLPSLRDLAAWLESVGVPTSAATVAGDLKALDLDNPRVVQRKKRRRAQSRQRKFL